MNKPLTHAGCVVFRHEAGKILFLAVTSSSGKHWVLPQGHIEKGETPNEAALRELREEAGVIGEIAATLSVREYEKSKEKVSIQYFLIQANGFVQTNEERSLRWEEEQAARKLLSFDAAQDAVKEGAEILRRMN